jgi:hypothetical protein
LFVHLSIGALKDFGDCLSEPPICYADGRTGSELYVCLAG